MPTVSWILRFFSIGGGKTGNSIVLRASLEQYESSKKFKICKCIIGPALFCHWKWEKCQQYRAPGLFRGAKI